MSNEPDNGLFSKIKKTVTANHKTDTSGQTGSCAEFSIFDTDDFATTAPPQPNDLEVKLRSASQQRLKEQEEKFAEILKAEKEQYHRFLKEKYQAAAKTLLETREQKLIHKYEQEINALKLRQLEQENALKLQTQQTVTEQRLQIEKLQQELFLQQQLLQSKIEEAQAAARQEQEELSRELHENLLNANKNEIVSQAEQKYAKEMSERIAEQSALIIAEHNERLHAALHEQEQQLHQQYSEQISKQNELFDFRLQQEIVAATAAMQAEFAREKQELKDYIARIRPDVDANLARVRAEVTAELRLEFDRELEARKQELLSQLNNYKQELAISKQVEIDTLLAAERERLSQEIQQENAIVLKYKERELREASTVELAQTKEQLRLEQQQQVENAVQERTQQILCEYQSKLNQAIETVKTEQDEKVKLAVIQERTRITAQVANEKKLLLQQQHDQLTKEHAIKLEELAIRLNDRGQDLAIKLAEREKELMAQHQSREQEIKHLLQAEKDRELLSLETRLRHEFALQLEQVKHAQSLTVPSFNVELFEQQKQAALQEQKTFLEAKFAEDLAVAQKTWQLEQQQAHATIMQTELVACEARLREEFQAILIEQRKQAGVNFAKQRDQAIKVALAEFKQECALQLQAEMEENRAKAAAKIEAELKVQYEAKLQHELTVIRQEMAQEQELMLAEQDERIAALSAQHAAALSNAQAAHEAAAADLLEEERKSLALRFAQDKADLINELTERFNQEKHATMQKYETELRDKLYKEMVKQKDHIQAKFAAAQEAALQDQKRRLEAKHKQEIERVKQGYFEPNAEHASKLDQVIAERGVEQLAERILAKFHQNEK